jgi:hypothetical protein
MMLLYMFSKLPDSTNVEVKGNISAICHNAYQICMHILMISARAHTQHPPPPHTYYWYWNKYLIKSPYNSDPGKPFLNN